MTKKGRKSETKLQQWLNQFSERVDYTRFQKGMNLYNDHRVHGFQVFPNHFECQIEGQHDPYEVRGYYRLEDGIPILNDYEVVCSCPDEKPICKHGVCATMFFILNELSTEQKDTEDRVRMERSAQIEEPLNELQQKVAAQTSSILELHSYRGSRNIPNKDYIETVHARVVSVMDELKKRQ
ncbi:SWIM zinc finger family protein [Pseudalkalibacillus sp. Hm43]|uniref:SWIM zinc finger family protein n=1 Tax=Pseudalkalibacillus sp. Hm43 TaxID=3450742 RepID=UPI003F42D67F